MRPGLWTLRSAKKGDETIETGRQRGRFAQGSVQGSVQGSAKTLAGDPQATLKTPSTTLKHVCMNPQTTLKRPSGTLGSGDCQAAIPAGAQKRILMGCGAILYRSARRIDTVNQPSARLCLCPQKLGMGSYASEIPPGSRFQGAKACLYPRHNSRSGFFDASKKNIFRAIRYRSGRQGLCNADLAPAPPGGYALGHKH